jgi:hypothetical protein
VFLPVSLIVDDGSNDIPDIAPRVANCLSLTLSLLTTKLLPNVLRFISSTLSLSKFQSGSTTLSIIVCPRSYVGLSVVICAVLVVTVAVAV